MELMDKEKHSGRPKKRVEDRHKPGHHVRVNQAIYDLMRRLADRNITTATVEIHRACRELLQREGLWPPAAPGE